MGKGLFITGTDTAVGKTFVACSLAAYLRELGYRVGVMKPVETGCVERDGELFPEDAVQLKNAAGLRRNLSKKSARIDYLSRWRRASLPNEPA